MGLPDLYEIIFETFLMKCTCALPLTFVSPNSVPVCMYLICVVLFDQKYVEILEESCVYICYIGALCFFIWWYLICDSFNSCITNWNIVCVVRYLSLENNNSNHCYCYHRHHHQNVICKLFMYGLLKFVWHCVRRLKITMEKREICEWEEESSAGFSWVYITLWSIHLNLGRFSIQTGIFPGGSQSCGAGSYILQALSVVFSE